MIGNPSSKLLPLEQPYLAVSRDELAARESVVIGLTSGMAHWAGLAIAWLEAGLPVDAELAELLLEVAQQRGMPQQLRHQAFALAKRWQRRVGMNRTSQYLREARASLSEAAEGTCAAEIEQFDEFLHHNELELALNALETAFTNGDSGNRRVLELIAKAAGSMQLVERQQQYDDWLSLGRG